METVFDNIPKDIPTQWNTSAYKYAPNNSVLEMTQRNAEIAEAMQKVSPQQGGCDKKYIQFKTDAKRKYLVRYDNKKKFIVKNKTRVYLTEVRGKYVYVNT